MPFPVQQIFLWFIFFCALVQCVCVRLSFFPCFLSFLSFFFLCSNCICGFRVSHAQWGAVNAWAYSLQSSTQSKPPVGTGIIAWHRERSMKQQLETLTCPMWGRGIWNAAEINPLNSLYPSVLTQSQVSVLDTVLEKVFCEINQFSHQNMLEFVLRKKHLAYWMSEH